MAILTSKFHVSLSSKNLCVLLHSRLQPTHTLAVWYSSVFTQVKLMLVLTCSTLALVRRNVFHASSKCTLTSRTQWRLLAAVISVQVLVSRISVQVIPSAQKMLQSCSKLWTSQIQCLVSQLSLRLKRTSTVSTKVCRNLLKKIQPSKLNLTKKPAKPLSVVWVSFTSTSSSTVCVVNSRLNVTKAVHKLPTRKLSPSQLNSVKCSRSNLVVVVSSLTSSAA